MKKEEILEGNKLLAEFMGNEFTHGGIVSFKYSSGESFPLSGRDFNAELIEDEIQQELYEFGSTLEIEVVNFHSSWGWIMPVVRKILDYCSENDEMDRYYLVIDNIPDIQSVFQSCVEFAKWYKNQAV